MQDGVHLSAAEISALTGARLSRSAFAIWLALRQEYAVGETAYCGSRALAQMAGVARPCVQAALIQLELAGFLVAEGNGPKGVLAVRLQLPDADGGQAARLDPSPAPAGYPAYDGCDRPDIRPMGVWPPDAQEAASVAIRGPGLVDGDRPDIRPMARPFPSDVLEALPLYISALSSSRARDPRSEGLPPLSARRLRRLAHPLRLPLGSRAACSVGWQEELPFSLGVSVAVQDGVALQVPQEAWEQGTSGARLQVPAAALRPALAPGGGAIVHPATAARSRARAALLALRARAPAVRAPLPTPRAQAGLPPAIAPSSGTFVAPHAARLLEPANASATVAIMQPFHAARPAVAPALAAPPAPAVFQPRLELGPRGEEETRLRASVIRSLLDLPGWYSQLPDPLRISRTEAFLDRFVARFSHAAAAAWLGALEVPEIAATVDKPGAWIRSHFNGYSRERGWAHKTQWQVALLHGDLPRAIELFRLNVRRKAAQVSRTEAEDLAAATRAGWHQVQRNHPEIAAAQRAVADAWCERGGVTNPVTGYGAHERVRSGGAPPAGASPVGGAPEGAVGLVPAPVRI